MRVRFVVTLLCAFSFYDFDEATAQPRQEPELTYESLEQCMVPLQKPYPCDPGCLTYEVPGSLIDEDGGYFSLPGEFDKFGRAGISALLKLLEDPDPTIRARAGMVIANLNTLQPEDTPEILAASLNDNGWIDGAPARIRTPQAIASLVEGLKKFPLLSLPRGAALQELGNRAVPFLLDALDCKTEAEYSTDLPISIGKLANEPGIQSNEIQEHLVVLATTETRSQDARVGALLALHDLAPSDAPIRPRIRALLSDRNEAVRSAAMMTLVVWSDESAVAPLIQENGWRANIVWRLPGAPLGAIATRIGILGIITNYGEVIFRPASRLEWISCCIRE